jgi:hypothetical protein
MLQDKLIFTNESDNCSTWEDYAHLTNAELDAIIKDLEHKRRNKNYQSATLNQYHYDGSISLVKQ